nr:MAG TPA: hypothetical protein [Caudoviricetes sp.]
MPFPDCPTAPDPPSEPPVLPAVVSRCRSQRDLRKSSALALISLIRL